MGRVGDIVVVSVSLEVRSEGVLFILLAKDGTINRMGTGSAGNTERNLFIGRTNQPLLGDLLSRLTDDMLRHTGTYDVKEKRGIPCRLSILMQFQDGSEDGFIITYGSESQGPPREIRAFVEAAAQITESWYSDQKAIKARAGESRRQARDEVQGGRRRDSQVDAPEAQPDSALGWLKRLLRKMS